MLQTLHTHVSPSTAPRARVKGLGVGQAASLGSEMELIFTAFLPGAGTPWFPSEVSKDREKLTPCPLKQAGGWPAVGHSAEALGVRVRGGDLARGQSS